MSAGGESDGSAGGCIARFLQRLLFAMHRSGSGGAVQREETTPEKAERRGVVFSQRMWALEKTSIKLQQCRLETQGE